MRQVILMKVEVKLFDLLRRYAPDNQNVFHVQLQPGVSVGELLEKLQIPPSVRRTVLVNGRRVEDKTLLSSDDTLVIMSPIEGG